MSCIITDCKNDGTETITDATQYPEKYNGKLLCKEHFADREYMKLNDVFVDDIEKLKVVVD